MLASPRGPYGLGAKGYMVGCFYKERAKKGNTQERKDGEKKKVQSVAQQEGVSGVIAPRRPLFNPSVDPLPLKTEMRAMAAQGCPRACSAHQQQNGTTRREQLTTTVTKHHKVKQRGAVRNDTHTHTHREKGWVRAVADVCAREEVSRNAGREGGDKGGKERSSAHRLYHNAGEEKKR
jgi:hypothetical protein